MYSQSSDCTPPKERPESWEEWTCEELDQFDTVVFFYTVEGYAIKGVQMAIFTYVILTLVYQRCKGKQQIGAISMLIAVLSLLESGLSMIRIYTLFPFAENNSILGLIFSGENICFFGAIWLFVISYYETALNFE